ncbi:MAG: DNA repair exonuclease [Nanoarchaeota archaeon]|nr:DNA repair exonuclease [Nanoarchaeota archaeon]
MVRFAHMADVHLGGWKQQPLQDLNFTSFQKAIDICIQEKVDFVLIAGDLFDSAYPPIEILKKTFSEFKKLNDSKIPCFFIAGSHDYSVSGKTFLDVLENTGFCKNIANFEIINDELILNPTVHEGIALYGYPGKKTCLEVKDLRKMKLKPSDSTLFKILMLHTTIDKAKGDLPIDSVEADGLPDVDYYAMGHLHIDFQYKNFVYPGPVFPNNFSELEKLKHGNFYIVDADLKNFSVSLKKVELKIKEVEHAIFDIKNAVTATEEIIFELNKRNLTDKIVLLRLKGELENSKVSNIDLPKIEEFVMKKGAYFILKNTHDLKTREEDIEFEVGEEDIEEETVKLYTEKNHSELNRFTKQLIDSLSIEKQEGETSEGFSKRIFDESKKILNF